MLPKTFTGSKCRRVSPNNYGAMVVNFVQTQLIADLFRVSFTLGPTIATRYTSEQTTVGFKSGIIANVLPSKSCSYGVISYRVTSDVDVLAVLFPCLTCLGP